MSQGTFYKKKVWDGRPLPAWGSAKELLPQPVFDRRPEAIAAYDEAWRGCITALRQPTPANRFVSNHLFMPFNDCIFAHDTAVMVLFARYGLRVFNAAESFDNFYAKQHETGEICREIRCSDGRDYWEKAPSDPVMVHFELTDRSQGYQWTRPTVGTHPPGQVELDGLNDPCAIIWGELAAYALSADRARLQSIIEPQKRWYEAFRVYLRDVNGLYITDWGSADNHPRNFRLGYGIDVACQVVFFARLLAAACRICGDRHAADYERDARRISRLVRSLMWDEASGFFYDLDRNGKRMEYKSVFGFWPLEARVATSRQAAALVRHLHDPKEFDRPVLVPTLAASEAAYVPLGSYLFGGVFPFTNVMVMEGLERYGLAAEAQRIARNYWEASIEVFQATGTHWEFLQPEARLPGRSLSGDGWNARPDFTGWGAWAPISVFLENIIGLRVDAPSNAITWNLAETGRCGCKTLAFGPVVADLVADARSDREEKPRVTCRTNLPFTLEIRWGSGKRARTRMPSG